MNAGHKWLPIVSDHCTGCAICVQACDHGCLELVWSFARLQRPEDCGSEGTCAAACPEDAIHMDWTPATGDHQAGQWRDGDEPIQRVKDLDFKKGVMMMMLKKPILLALLAGCVVLAGVFAVGQFASDDSALRAAIGDVASIELRTFEETKKARNDRLNDVFRTHLQASKEPATAQSVQQFQALLHEHGLTSFDDFQRDEMSPRREVQDPVSGQSVPVFGPLGSDLINPWLADMEIVEGKPLEEQPAYNCAKNALREHVDFALIGVVDPNLSLSMLPAKLRENAESFYRRLNPTNRFDGGFDHPLFYATVRFAAKKLFREDYPQAKLSMAQLVASEAHGGFGTRSCLLCHDGNHAGVYRRLLGQGLYLEAKAREAHAGSHEAIEAQRDAANYLLAAQHVREASPDTIDDAAIRQSLSLNSAHNLERLKPGYDDFRAKLTSLGCLNCHGTDGQPPQGKDPREHGAWVLHPSTYHKTENIKALLSVIDVNAVERSSLILKATAQQDHEGAVRVKLDRAKSAELQGALVKWLTAF